MQLQIEFKNKRIASAPTQCVYIKSKEFTNKLVIKVNVDRNKVFSKKERKQVKSKTQKKNYENKVESFVSSEKK